MQIEAFRDHNVPKVLFPVVPSCPYHATQSAINGKTSSYAACVLSV
jgi:hypothetical protein